jgi:hypothetical protein
VFAKKPQRGCLLCTQITQIIQIFTDLKTTHN